jgi:hypothetical protein
MASKVDILRAQLYQSFLEKHQHVERLKVLDTAITALIAQVAVFEQQEREEAAKTPPDRTQNVRELAGKRLSTVPAAEPKLDEAQPGDPPDAA